MSEAADATEDLPTNATQAEIVPTEDTFEYPPPGHPELGSQGWTRALATKYGWQAIRPLITKTTKSRFQKVGPIHYRTMVIDCTDCGDPTCEFSPESHDRMFGLDKHTKCCSINAIIEHVTRQPYLDLVDHTFQYGEPNCGRNPNNPVNSDKCPPWDWANDLKDSDFKRCGGTDEKEKNRRADQDKRQCKVLLPTYLKNRGRSLLTYSFFYEEPLPDTDGTDEIWRIMACCPSHGGTLYRRRERNKRLKFLQPQDISNLLHSTTPSSLTPQQLNSIFEWNGDYPSECRAVHNNHPSDITTARFPDTTTQLVDHPPLIEHHLPIIEDHTPLIEDHTPLIENQHESPQLEPENMQPQLYGQEADHGSGIDGVTRIPADSGVHWLDTEYGRVYAQNMPVPIDCESHELEPCFKDLITRYGAAEGGRRWLNDPEIQTVVSQSLKDYGSFFVSPSNHILYKRRYPDIDFDSKQFEKEKCVNPNCTNDTFRIKGLEGIHLLNVDLTPDPNADVDEEWDPSIDTAAACSYRCHFEGQRIEMENRSPAQIFSHQGDNRQLLIIQVDLKPLKEVDPTLTNIFILATQLLKQSQNIRLQVQVQVLQGWVHLLLFLDLQDPVGKDRGEKKFEVQLLTAQNIQYIEPRTQDVQSGNGLGKGLKTKGRKVFWASKGLGRVAERRKVNKDGWEDDADFIGPD